MALSILFGGVKDQEIKKKDNKSRTLQAGPESALHFPPLVFQPIPPEPPSVSFDVPAD